MAQDIKNRFINLKQKIEKIIEENNRLNGLVLELRNNEENKNNIIQLLKDENGRLKEDIRLLRVKAELERDTSGLKKELEEIRRDIEESLTLMRDI